MRNERTLPKITHEHNKKLDQQIVDREPLDYDAPWVQRRYWATLYSTMRAWLLRQ